METSVSPTSPSPSFVSEDVSFEDSYFYTTYVPLSNFPTPPSSHLKRPTRPLPSSALFYSDEVLNRNFLGPAILLTNLIPVSSSFSEPSVPLVHAILTRADLPLETVALAVAILDSLNSKFSASWRRNCPLYGTLNSHASHKDCLPCVPCPIQGDLCPKHQQHIDAVNPEIIALCSLILAAKYVDDFPIPTTEYAADWGKRMWTCEQINFTERILFENLGYKLLTLWEPSLIQETMANMDRASLQYASSQDYDVFGPLDDAQFGAEKDLVWLKQQALTPPHTPQMDDGKIFDEYSVVIEGLRVPGMEECAIAHEYDVIF